MKMRPLPVKMGLVAVAVIAAAIAYAWPEGSGPVILVPGDQGGISAEQTEEVQDRRAGTLDSETTLATQQQEGRTEIRSVQGDRWEVRGKVVDRNKKPLSKVRFRGEMFAGYHAKGIPVSKAELVSKDDGSFAWDLPKPVGTVSLRFSAPMEQVRFSTWSEFYIAGSEAPEGILLRAWLLDGTIVGRVLGEGGDVLEGAQVRYRRSGPHFDCDDRGRYRIPVPSSSSRLLLYASAPGHAVIRKNITSPERGGERVADFQLSPALIIQGRVVDEDGHPIENARVKTFYTGFFREILTDAKGRFELDYLERGRPTHSLYARKEGYIEGRTQVRTDAPAPSYELVLKRGIRLIGRVTGPDGAAIPGARLYIGFDPSAYDRIDSISEDDGRFEFPTVKQGLRDLVTEAPGFAPKLQKLDLHEDILQPVRLEVRLETGRKVRGVVVDAEDEPLPGIGIHARSHAPGDRMGGRYVGERTKTNASGEFELTNMASGKIDVECYGRGVVRHVERGVSTDAKMVVRIQMTRSGRLAGRALDGKTGQPLNRFRVRIISHQGSGGVGATWMREGYEFRDTNGYWDSRTENLTQGGNFVMGISAPGYGEVTQKIIATIKPDADAHTVRLMPGQKVVGRVVQSETGAAIVGARIIVITEGRPYQPGSHEGFHGRVVSTTDAAGRFALEDVPLGQVSLGVQHAQWPYTVEGPFEVHANMPNERLIQIEKPGGIRGVVRDGLGKPVVGARLRAFAIQVSVQPTGALHATTDAQGKFAFKTRLNPGIYSVRVTPWEKEPPFTVLAMMAQVQLGQETELEMKPAGTCELIGRIQSDPPFTKAMSLTVSRRRPGAKEGDPMARETFNAKSLGSRIHLRGFAPGTYTVWGFHNGSMAQARAVLTPEKPAEVLLKLIRPKSARGK